MYFPKCLFWMCLMGISQAFLTNAPISSSEKYIESLNHKKTPSTYLDGLSPPRRRLLKPVRREKKKTTPEIDNAGNQTVFMNATFVINQISPRGFFNTNNARPSSQKSSDSGHFQLQDVSAYNFSSIGGYTNIKKHMSQMLDMIENPENYSAYNVRIPKGILLYGPPGNGKTLLARCFAGESGLPIIATSGSEFQEKYVGTGPARIRELFDFARDNSPCMIFIDELDAVARKRGSDGEAAQAERDSTLNQLLVELDGFASLDNQKIFVVASTNRIDILDPALLRPGRMDKKIQVPLPDHDTRREILKIHLYRKPIDTDIEWMVHELTEGMSGADIEHLLNEAVLSAIRKNSLPVNSTLLEYIRDMNIIGNDAHLLTPITGELAFRVAIHEIGHVLVAIHSIHHDNPKKCSISGNKKMLGYTLFPPRNASLMTFNGLADRIKVLLGGRIAEEIVFGAESVSTGAADDLQQCQQLAHDMILLYGMGDQLVYPRLSDASKKEIDDAVFSIVRAKYMEAKTILTEHRDVLTRLSHELVQKQDLTLDEILLHVHNV